MIRFWPPCWKAEMAIDFSPPGASVPINGQAVRAGIHKLDLACVLAGAQGRERKNNEADTQKRDWDFSARHPIPQTSGCSAHGVLAYLRASSHGVGRDWSHVVLRCLLATD